MCTDREKSPHIHMTAIACSAASIARFLNPEPLFQISIVISRRLTVSLFANAMIISVAALGRVSRDRAV